MRARSGVNLPVFSTCITGASRGHAPAPRRAARDLAPEEVAQEGVCVLQRPLFSHCVLGRTPAAGRRAPQRVAVTLPESTFGFADQRRGLCCATRPLLTSFGRTPASGRRDPCFETGGLLSSAFLAVVVRVHGEVGPGQQKANPNVDSSSVTATLWGARRESRGTSRARSARRGDVAKRKPRL